jgi:hypothetical protein
LIYTPLFGDWLRIENQLFWKDKFDVTLSDKEVQDFLKDHSGYFYSQMKGKTYLRRFGKSLTPPPYTGTPYFNLDSFAGIVRADSIYIMGNNFFSYKYGLRTIVEDIKEFLIQFPIPKEMVLIKMKWDYPPLLCSPEFFVFIVGGN